MNVCRTPAFRSFRSHISPSALALHFHLIVFNCFRDNFEVGMHEVGRWIDRFIETKWLFES